MSYPCTVSYPSVQITGLLQDWGKGESEALERLLPLVFDDLRIMARQSLRREYDSSLQPTALVNEVFLKLLDRRSLSWKNRSQFFGFVSQQMRRILVDHARKRRTMRRGWGWSPVSLDEAVAIASRRDIDLLALDDALDDLSRIDPELCRLVELRFFVGLNQEEIGEVLGTSRATVGRRLKAARTWLYRELSRKTESRSAVISEADGSNLETGESSETGEGPGEEKTLSGGGQGTDDTVDPLPNREGSPSRYLHGRLPGSVRLGQAVALQVRVGVEPGQCPSALLDSLDVGPDGTEILLVLHSPGFEQQNGNCQRLRVLENEDSAWAVFELKAVGRGSHALEVSAFDRGRYLGSLRLDTDVEVDQGTQTSLNHFAEIRPGRGTPGTYTLLVDYDDVRKVYVYRLIDSDLGVSEATYSNLFKKTPEAAIAGYLEQVQSHFGSGSSLNRSQTHQWLRGLGMSLWDEFVPRLFQEKFWNHRDQIEQILVVSKDDFVPWEILCPYRSGRRNDGEFLADLFSIGRWRHGSRPSTRLSLEHGVLVKPPGTLSLAGLEVAEIRSLLDRSGAEVTGPLNSLDDLLRVLAEGQFDLLHFACHQAFDAGFPPASRIRMGNKDFQPIFLKTHSGRFVDNSPLIFLNACESDGKAPVSTQIGGWANAFLEAGAGAFVGTLWEVSDRSAKEFAIEFYQKFLDSESRSSTLGEALRAARAAIRDRPGDPTWLAYTLYGDPSARWVEDSSIPKGSGRRE